jgi:hypothetical protein
MEFSPKPVTTGWRPQSCSQWMSCLWFEDKRFLLLLLPFSCPWKTIMHLITAIVPLILVSCQVVLCKKANVIKLDEESWTQLLTGEWMVEL